MGVCGESMRDREGSTSVGALGGDEGGEIFSIFFLYRFLSSEIVGFLLMWASFLTVLSTYRT